MIFQIDYQSDGKYERFYKQNSWYHDLMDYKLFDDQEIEKYLKDYGWAKKFESAVISPGSGTSHSKAIRCDLLRLMMLYDFGGCYLDADIVFEPDIVNLEDNLQQQYPNTNIVQDSRCMCFIRGIKHSDFMGYWLHYYLTSEYLTYDIHMNTGYEQSDFPNDLVIKPDHIFHKYFRHVNISTGPCTLFCAHTDPQ